MTRIKVMIAVPHGGSVSMLTQKTIGRIHAKTDPTKVEFVFDEGGFVERRGVLVENQNDLVSDADRLGADYMLLIEGDNGCGVGEALNILLSHGKEIVGCTYAYKDTPALVQALSGPTLLRYMGAELGHPEGNPLGEIPITFETLRDCPPLRPVRYIPTGFILISTKAINIVRDWRKEDYRKKGMPLPDGVRPAAFVHLESYNPVTHPDRTMMTTTDAAFCYFARMAGLDVWLDAHLSRYVEHVGDVNFVMPAAAWTPALHNGA